MITFFAIAALFCSSSQAQELLTHSQGNLLITASLSDSLLREDFLARMDEVTRFITETLPAKVPADLRTKIANEPMKIEVTNTGVKGALFLVREKTTGRLLIQINRLYFTNATLYRMLAHEWFHALHYVVHPDEPAWLREGLAQVFEHIAMGGYSGPSLLDALDQSTTPLEYDFKLTEVSPEAYGHTFLYFYFLYSKCGGDKLFWNLVRSELSLFGRDNINAALSGNPLRGCQSFEASAADAEVARFQNRKIYKVSADQQDHYWIVPTLSREPQLNSESELALFAKLPAFQPLLLSSKAHDKVAAILKQGVRVYTLDRQYPYTVTEGLSNGSSLDEILLVIKTRSTDESPTSGSKTRLSHK